MRTDCWGLQAACSGASSGARGRRWATGAGRRAWAESSRGSTGKRQVDARLQPSTILTVSSTGTPEPRRRPRLLSLSLYVLPTIDSKLYARTDPVSRPTSEVAAQHSGRTGWSVPRCHLITHPLPGSRQRVLPFQTLPPPTQGSKSTARIQLFRLVPVPSEYMHLFQRPTLSARCTLARCADHPRAQHARNVNEY